MAKEMVRLHRDLAKKRLEEWNVNNRNKLPLAGTLTPYERREKLKKRKTLVVAL